MKAGEIKFYKIGKSVRFDDAMVNEFLSKQRQKMYQLKNLSFKNKDNKVSGFSSAFTMLKDGKENG